MNAVFIVQFRVVFVLLGFMFFLMFNCVIIIDFLSPLLSLFMAFVDQSWVGVGISNRYRFFGISVGIFSSRFGICCRFFKISRYRFGSVLFDIPLCVKAPRADQKILLPSQSANCDRRSVFAKLLLTEAIRCPLKRRLTGVRARVGVNLAYWMHRTQKNAIKQAYTRAQCSLLFIHATPLQRHSKH